MNIVNRRHLKHFTFNIKCCADSNQRQVVRQKHLDSSWLFVWDAVDASATWYINYFRLNIKIVTVYYFYSVIPTFHVALHCCSARLFQNLIILMTISHVHSSPSDISYCDSFSGRIKWERSFNTEKHNRKQTLEGALSGNRWLSLRGTRKRHCLWPPIHHNAANYSNFRTFMFALFEISNYWNIIWIFLWILDITWYGNAFS